MTIDQIIDDVLDREGGYVHHPDDKGGPTKFGITLQALREWRYPVPVVQADVQGLTRMEARMIYRRQYIEAPGYAEAISDDRLLALVVDYAVHSGPGRATKALQRALGVTDDGVLGAQTKRVLASQAGSPGVYRKLLAARIGALCRLAVADPSQLVFLDGWLTRVVAFVCLLLALALPARVEAQAITRIAAVGNGGSAIFNDGTETFTLATTPNANDLVCYQIGFATLTASGITSAAWGDAAGSWTIFTLLTGANSGALSMACSSNPSGSSNQFTITSASESSGNVRGVIWHMRTTGTWGALTAHVSGSAANAQASPHSSGSVTPSDADNVCMGLIKGGNNTYTSEAGWSALTTAFGDSARGAAGYLIQTAATAQSYDPTSSGAVDRAVQIVCIDSSAGGGGGVLSQPVHLTTGGVGGQ